MIKYKNIIKVIKEILNVLYLKVLSCYIYLLKKYYNILINIKQSLLNQLN